MITSSLSIWLGLTFILVGAINVCLILQASARVRDAKASSRLIAAHRIGGYLFIALYCAMGYYMLSRLGEAGAGSPPATMIHLTLAMVLSPLLFIKVLIARYYKSYSSFLLPIGLVIFVLSFVLIGVAVGPELARRPDMQTVALAAIDLPPAHIDINAAAATMEKRCSKCHNLDRIEGARKDAQGWLATVNRMRALPDSGISEADARTIVSYLALRLSPKEPAAVASLEVGRGLVDQRCGRCHNLDRVYKTVESPAEWRATVAEMAGFAQGSANALHPGEQEQIVAYLSATQTPEALQKRKIAAAAGPGAPVEKAAAAAEPRPARDAYDWKTVGLASLLGLGLLTLIVRRPGRPGAGVKQIVLADPAARPAAGPLILRLASIAQQTSDARTLRFVVEGGDKLSARPGQFLTFNFLFDGKKISRSYSICSSAARSGYVEITPKRVSGGCVSVFLNDRARVGLTVEAKGPFGRFCFDEGTHSSIVLLAGGSGITPMMAMLRYIDDLCLPTTVTLLYCVRTARDVIFQSELEELRARLRNFQFHLLPSQPGEDWSGPTGHISREFITTAVSDLASRDFFLCGPPPFMDASRAILTDVGVKPERIRQETFGSSAPANTRAAATVGTDQPIDFVRSGKSVTVRSGQSLLEAAEANGVAIPFSCRQGQCGTCKTKLLEGKVRMDAEEGLDSVSRSEGFILTCVGHADGPVRLDA